MEPLVLSGRSTGYQVWREKVCDEMFGLEAPRRPPRSFDIAVKAYPFGAGNFAVLENRGDTYRVARSASAIASRPSPGEWMLGFCIDGLEVTRIDNGAESCTPRGGLRLLHANTPMVGSTPSGTRIAMLFLPDALCAAASQWQPLSLPFPVGMARVLAATISSIVDEIPRLSANDLRQLVSSIVPLIEAVAAPSRESAERALPSVRLVQRRRVLAFIDAHLADASLRAGWIAGMLGISARYLHALFAGEEQSVGEIILALRLGRCRAAILDPAQAHRSLTDIAFEWGFNDASHFTRAFRRHFGITPSDARRSRS